MSGALQSSPVTSNSKLCRLPASHTVVDLDLRTHCCCTFRCPDFVHWSKTRTAEQADILRIWEGNKE